MIKKIIKLIKIVVPLIIVLLVLGRVFITPILDEEGAKGKREPLYVKKYYEFKTDNMLRSLRKNNKDKIPNEMKKKYFLENIYIYPKINSTGYGNQIEKSWSNPYSFSIFARTFESNIEVTISNVKIFEKKFFFFKKEIFSETNENKYIIDFFIENDYVTHKKYTKDLNVSKIYMKPLIVTFDVSGKVDGEIVTKSMEYTLTPVIERGVQGPMWMYQ